MISLIPVGKVWDRAKSSNEASKYGNPYRDVSLSIIIPCNIYGAPGGTVDQERPGPSPKNCPPKIARRTVATEDPE